MAQGGIDPTTTASFRKEVAECARNFKASWIRMGRYVHSVHSEKLYRGWGFHEFETYCAKELGIKPQTAVKLLRSYYFLEKEEPDYAREDRFRGEDAPRIPDYESVNLLRLAKNRKLDEDDYAGLRKKVLEEGLPAQFVRHEYRKALERQEPAADGGDAEAKRRVTVIRRSVSVLKTLQKELAAGRFLSKKQIGRIASLIEELESEML